MLKILCKYSEKIIFVIKTLGNGLSKRPNNIKKLHKGTHIHFRKIVTFEFVEMAVVAYNIFGSCGNGAIHKLVVVGIGSD